ncbi:hypothetical protein AYI68_g3090, partial [Smittium mucronatum]
MFNSFRDKVIADDSLEERVEVNQRHLIDKILARYSAEFTVFRELIQNANDAEAKNLKIRFLTSEYNTNKKNESDSQSSEGNSDSSDLFPNHKTFSSTEQSVEKNSVTLNEKYTTIIVSNNGKEFSKQDWNRLKKIAEGNPDEQKIGFFGVGFYSLFSICEEPFVISGDECMAFYWKGDQLYTKKTNKGDIKVGLEEDESDWTWFIMQIRDEPTTVPDPVKFGRFLSTALAFTKCLMNISVFIDDSEVFKVNKIQKEFANQSLPSEVGFLGFKKEKYLLESPQKLFGIKNINKYTFLIECSYIQLHKETSIIGEITSLVSDIFKNKDTAALSTSNTFLDKKLGGFFSSWMNPFRSISDGSKDIKNKPQSQEIDQKQPKTVEHIKLVLKKESIILRIAESQISVDVPRKMADHMERATKKPPPKSSSMQVIWGINSQIEKEKNNIISDEKVENSNLLVLGQLAAYPQQGSVFIGFATHQTTGCSAHLAAQFIPTVERESIDFIDPALAKWNRELLSIFGIMCRILHDTELDFISEKFSQLKDELRADGNKKSVMDIFQLEKFIKLADHSAQILNFFTPRFTTPSNLPGELFSNVFFGCTELFLPILTLCGVIPSTKALLYSKIESSLCSDVNEMKLNWGKTNGSYPSVLNLVFNLPIIPPEVIFHSRKMIRILSELDRISIMGVKDVINDINSGEPFTSDMAVGIINWWFDLPNSKYSYQTLFINSIKIKCSLVDYTSDSQKNNDSIALQFPNFVFSLKQARYFVNPKNFTIFDISIFENFPKANMNLEEGLNFYLPYSSSTLPLSVSLKFKTDTLQSLFCENDQYLPLKELPLSLYINHIISNKMMSTLLQSPVIIKKASQSKDVDNISAEDDNVYPIACTLLKNVAKMWSRMSADDHVVIISTLYEVKIIPTIGGLQKPCNSYLPSANLFPDLPIVLRSVIKICKESLLIELGVKKHVDLQLIFDRIDTELKWDHIQLVKYLTSVSDTLTDAEYNKLKSASIFPAQEMQMDQNTSNPGDISSKRKIYRANELYFPSEKITNLGLPVLKWNKHGLFNFPSSPEGIFLAKLGMQTCPNILELVTIASKQPINNKISSDINFSIDSDASLRTKALEYLL